MNKVLFIDELIDFGDSQRSVMEEIVPDLEPGTYIEEPKFNNYPRKNRRSVVKRKLRVKERKAEIGEIEDA